ncbi:MAG: acetate--CoA ligase family protein [Nitrososphaerota archaeon]|nr:acetate--CoA ligase family protein [Nitrososphaerota archaeon]MDG6923013.1 acetate--CoA ligase family protein [Nitrososphaerota archaeon]
MSDELIKQILTNALKENRFALYENESKAILKRLEISVPEEQLATTTSELEKALEKTGYPAVMKIVSPDIIHKSDVGGVETDVRDLGDARKTFDRILKNVSEKAPGSKIRGIVVQSKATGIELVVGAKRDSTFGAFVLFGVGGVLVELLKDVSIRYCPVSKSSALDMIQAIRSFPLLSGYRGRAGVDLNTLADVICKISELIEGYPEISEIDVNPLIIGKGSGCTAADARIILSRHQAQGTTDLKFEAGAKPQGAAVGTLLEAQSLVIVGASRDPTKIGSRLLSKILSHKYGGVIDVINPKGESIAGLTTFKSIREIAHGIDAAILGVPVDASISVMEDCAANHVKTAIVISGGFAESGGEGIEKQAKLLEIARRGGVRLIGPNTVGVLRPSAKLYANFSTFAEKTDINSGNVGFVTQSGALGAALVSRAADAGVKISSWVSTGNEADLDWIDVVDYYVNDDQSKVIVAYVEGVKDGNKLKIVAQASTESKKPIIMFKSGITNVGESAAKSHTGAIAVDDTLLDAFVNQFGILRVNELSDTFEIAKAFSLQPMPRGPGVGVISASGGANVIICDELTKRGISIPELTSETQSKLAKSLQNTMRKNPVDMAGTVISNPALFKETTLTVLEDPNIDEVIIAVPGGSEELASIHARGIADCSSAGKPIVVAWLYSATSVAAALKILADANIPVYFDVEKAAKAAASMIQYRKFLMKNEQASIKSEF